MTNKRRAGYKPWYQPLFHPRTVALVGASKDPKKWGFNLLFNIVKGNYRGRVYPINPKESEILGFKAYPSIAQVPEPVDQAILVVPSWDMPKVIQECGKNGAKVGVVITAGFGEVDQKGKNVEEEMVSLARCLGMRLIGPNCQGCGGSGWLSRCCRGLPRGANCGRCAIVRYHDAVEGGCAHAEVGDGNSAR